MELGTFLAGFAAGAVLAAVAALFVLRGREHAAAMRRAELESTLRARDEEKARLEATAQTSADALEQARLETRRLDNTLTEERTRREAEARAAEERISELQKLRERLENTFKALSSEALRQNNTAFLELARESFGKLRTESTGELEKRKQAIQELVDPLRKSLEGVSERIREIEKAREGAYEGLREQVRGLLQTQGQLQRETGNLVQALRTPNVRGRWGEMHLQRTVEFAGMVEHIDFIGQASATGDDGTLRPDMIIRLPGGKNIVVDAKAPLEAYLRAVETEDAATKEEALAHHARQIRDHIRKLAAKKYWQQFSPTPELVVLFLPGEAFFSAALQKEPALIEAGARDNVLVATPTTLIALLRAIAFGWRQERIAEEAEAIARLGGELHERIGTLGGHFQNLANALNRSVSTFNQAMRSLDTRVLVTARRFESMGGLRTKALPDAPLIHEQAEPSANLEPPENK